MGFASAAGKILAAGGVSGALRGDRLARRVSDLLGGGVDLGAVSVVLWHERQVYVKSSVLSFSTRIQENGFGF